MTQVHLLAPALCLSSHKLIPKSHGANSSTYVSFALRGYADTGICKGSLNLLGIFLLQNQKGFIGFGDSSQKRVHVLPDYPTMLEAVDMCWLQLHHQQTRLDLCSHTGVPWLRLRAYYNCSYRRTMTAGTGILQLQIRAYIRAYYVNILLRIPYVCCMAL